MVRHELHLDTTILLLFVVIAMEPRQSAPLPPPPPEPANNFEKNKLSFTTTKFRDLHFVVKYFNFLPPQEAQMLQGMFYKCSTVLATLFISLR